MFFGGTSCKKFPQAPSRTLAQNNKNGFVSVRIDGRERLAKTNAYNKTNNQPVILSGVRST